MSLAGAVCAAWLSGCVPSRPMGQLPSHELDLAVPRRSAPRQAVLASVVPPGHLQAVQNDGDRPTGARAWRYIVIHHSATDSGNAGTFDIQHRRRGWDELGYHFVIDNGQGGPDGNVEVGSRWRSQKWGAHCGGTPNNEYNNYGIGICLVGDFSRSMPSDKQLSAMRRLVADLATEYGIAPDNIICHCDAPNATTECPGARLRAYVYGTLRRSVASAYAGR
jgi:N-acetyl-anhydromuramyl-L-alanine amidase AmpD